VEGEDRSLEDILPPAPPAEKPEIKEKKGKSRADCDEESDNVSRLSRDDDDPHNRRGPKPAPSRLIRRKKA